MITLLLKGEKLDITEEQSKKIPLINNLINCTSEMIELDIKKYIFVNVLNFMESRPFDCSIGKLLKTLDFLNMEKEYRILCNELDSKLCNYNGKLAFELDNQHFLFTQKKCSYCLAKGDSDDRCICEDEFVWNLPFLLRGLDEKIIFDIIGTVTVLSRKPYIYSWKNKLIYYDQMYKPAIVHENYDIKDIKKIFKINIKNDYSVYNALIALKTDNKVILLFHSREVELHNETDNIYHHSRNREDIVIIEKTNKDLIKLEKFTPKNGNGVHYNKTEYKFSEYGPLAISKTSNEDMVAFFKKKK